MLRILDILLVIMLISGNAFPIIVNLVVEGSDNVWMLVFNGFAVVVLNVMLYQKLKNYRNRKSL